MMAACLDFSELFHRCSFPLVLSRALEIEASSLQMASTTIVGLIN